MSRIGKQIVAIPEGVQVSVEGNLIKAKGPKGELSVPAMEGVKIEVKDSSIELSVKSKDFSAKWGLMRSLISNLVVGVKDGFKKVLEINGVGYKASKKGKDLELKLGFSHPVLIKVPEELEVNIEKDVTVEVLGCSKEAVGQFAAEIRDVFPPEPYKGKGIKYKDEKIIRKAGKKTAGEGAAGA